MVSRAHEVSCSQISSCKQVRARQRSERVNEAPGRAGEQMSWRNCSGSIMPTLTGTNGVWKNKSHTRVAAPMESSWCGGGAVVVRWWCGGGACTVLGFHGVCVCVVRGCGREATRALANEHMSSVTTTTTATPLSPYFSLPPLSLSLNVVVVLWSRLCRSRASAERVDETGKSRTCANTRTRARTHARTLT